MNLTSARQLSATYAYIYARYYYYAQRAGRLLRGLDAYLLAGVTRKRPSANLIQCPLAAEEEQAP